MRHNIPFAPGARPGFSLDPKPKPAYLPRNENLSTPYPVIDDLRKLSPEEINALPVKRWEGDVVLVNDEQGLIEAWRDLKRRKLLGFDTEKKPVFVRGAKSTVSICQLAAADRVYVFQLNRIADFSPLADILADRRIRKAGVAVADDLRDLAEVMAFSPDGFEDLADRAGRLRIPARGLKTLAAGLLGFRISKAQQTSDWSRPRLSIPQLVYAATDAWVGRELCLALDRFERAGHGDDA